jgi:hypothetical protein
MMTHITWLGPLAVIVAWLGSSMSITSKAQRGLAVGMVVSGAGLALAAALSGLPAVGGMLLLGAILGGVLRLRDGTPGWGLIPTGSTPWIVLCITVLAAALALNTSLHGISPALTAALEVGVLAAASLLAARDRASSLAAAALLTLALAATSEVRIAIVAAAVAIVLGTVPARVEAKSST